MDIRSMNKYIYVLYVCMYIKYVIGKALVDKLADRESDRKLGNFQWIPIRSTLSSNPVVTWIDITTIQGKLLHYSNSRKSSLKLC